MTGRGLFAALMATLVVAVPIAMPSPAVADTPLECDFAGSTPPRAGQNAARRPVVLVHGWTSARMDKTADALRKQLESRISTYVFDYSRWSSYWAADEHIAPCLAGYLKQVSAAYHDVGGDAKVIVVAYSMGGLATRYAMTNGSTADPVLATAVPYIITMGTPSLGSPWGGTAFSTGKEFIQKVFGHADPSGASGGDCLAEHDKGRPLPKDCGGLPPWLPNGVQLTQIAGDITVDRTIFGRKLSSIPLYSDGIVPVPSAHGYPTSGPSGTGPIDSGKSISGTDSCRVDFARVTNATMQLRFVVPRLLIDYVTLQDLQANRFSAPVMAYLGGATFTASCSHIHLPADQSALNQTTEKIRSAITALAQSPAKAIAPFLGKWYTHGGGLEIRSDLTGAQTISIGPCVVANLPDTPYCSQVVTYRFTADAQGAVSGKVTKIGYETWEGGKPPPGFSTDGDFGFRVGQSVTLRKSKKDMITVITGASSLPFCLPSGTSAAAGECGA